ncbi:MAG: hypothetical protein CSA38_00135 [Flavobacteriales bacterium]|nr:MAG: hypothetical protein CSA38_00135 [Flavobacteriales bacterium]
MPKMLNLGKELLRVNDVKGILEFSENGGKTWNQRCGATFNGVFKDLEIHKNELLAVTTKGVYVSENQGRTWNQRYVSNICGEFEVLQDNGVELLAQTSKGLYCSTNNGKIWNRR